VFCAALDVDGCDYAPNCHSRNRKNCVEPNKACGPCLDGFIGTKGFANDPCVLTDYDGEFRLPIIDLQSPTAEEEFRDATEEGFYLIKNHGIGQDLIDDVWKLSERFFNLPLSEKSNAKWSDPVGNIGYTTFDAEFLAEDGHTSDPKEAVDVDGSFILENEFFRNSSMHEYWNSILDLHHKLLRLIALSLELDENAFSDIHQENWGTIRLNHYPENPERTAVCGAHTDFGTVTILFQQSSGLEVLNRKSRQWIPVEASEDIAIVNFGDSMMKMTNDRLVSTMHRVRGTSHKRFSAAYFGHADKEYVMDASKFYPREPRKYRPMKSVDHMVLRRLITYDMVESPQSKNEL